MKKSLLTIIIVFAVFAISIGCIYLSDQEYLYFGKAWHDTPEEALAQKADQTAETLRTLTVKELLHKKEIDDIVVMAFVSQDDTLVTVSVVTNNEGLYCVSGYTVESFLDSPSEFVVTGDKEQFVLFPYKTHNDIIYGWCYSGLTPVVNGLIPAMETYEFECQGKVRTLNYWWIRGFSDDTNVEVWFQHSGSF